MSIRDTAKLARLNQTQARIDRAIARDKSRVTSTRLVSVDGYDPTRGKYTGTTPDGGVIYFSVESNATPGVKPIEVAIPSRMNYAKGDLRPLL